jgi:hypothetical protein
VCAGRNDLPHARSTDDGRWTGKGDAETTNETKTGRGELRRGGAIQRLGHVVANETCDTRVGSLVRGLAVSGSLVEAPVEEKQGSNELTVIPRATVGARAQVVEQAEHDLASRFRVVDWTAIF